MSDWKEVYDAALSTVGKTSNKMPSAKWKRRILLAEHSPIRLLTFTHTFAKIKYWVVMHLVRHKYGIEHFVKTQRGDRVDTFADRDEIPQGADVQYMLNVNAQALINISRKRLCHDAHAETRAAWTNVIDNINDPEIRAACVPECIYRGFCPSLSPCGYADTPGYQIALEGYRAPAKSMGDKKINKK